MPPMQDGPPGGAVRVVIASDAAQAVAELDRLAGYSDQVSLVGFARDPQELDDDLEALLPDLVLLHAGFADLDTASLAADLASRSARLRVLVAVDRRDRLLMTRVEDAGAATVRSDADPETLVAAIRGAVATEAPSEVAGEVAAEPVGMAPPAEGPSAESASAEPEAAPLEPPGVPVFQLDTTAFEAPGEAEASAPSAWPGVPLPAVVSPPAPAEAELEPIHPVRPRTAPRRPGGRAQLVVVFSGKGGVGKSLIATNLAVGLAVEGQRVALIDLDLQFGDVAVMLHVESHPTAIDALAQQGDQVDGDFIDEVMATGPEGVRALLAPSSPEFADLVNTANLRGILRELAKRYDHIVVDTPAHLEERNLEAIEMADQIIVVTSFNFAAIKDTKVTLKLLQSLGIPRERICVVLNQTRAKAGFPRSEVEESLRFRVVTVLPFEPKVDDCIDNGRPIITAEPKSEFSRQFRLLVAHLLGGGEGTEAVTEEAERSRSRTSRRRFSLGRG